jgi:L,D-transpeptidase YcbB
LNVPINDRIKQIMINLERLKWVPAHLPADYILVNIPEYKLHLFEANKPKFNIDVIVGKEMNKTVIFEGMLSTVVLNPYWSVPVSIVKNELVSHLKRDGGYLKRNNMEALYDNKVVSNFKAKNYSSRYTFRQKPGDKNALGKVKFLFPNSYNIYQHDAPAKHLFAKTERAFSHGCIRVSEPKKLALYLLNKKEAWSEEKLEEILKTNKEQYNAVIPKTPVYITYFTSWVDYT